MRDWGCVSLSSSVPVQPNLGLHEASCSIPQPGEGLEKEEGVRTRRGGGGVGAGPPSGSPGPSPQPLVAVGPVSRGVPGLWAASAALSLFCRSESHSWPGWQSACAGRVVKAHEACGDRGGPADGGQCGASSARLSAAALAARLVGSWGRGCALAGADDPGR